jgi:hypothetical protein
MDRGGGSRFGKGRLGPSNYPFLEAVLSFHIDSLWKTAANRFYLIYSNSRRHLLLPGNIAGGLDRYECDREPGKIKGMSNHPLNLALRFFLELVLLFALGYWGWTQHSELARWLWTIGLPLVAAILWGTFRVPGDPGQAPVAVPGAIRLGLEALLFGAAVWAFYASGKGNWAAVFAAVVLIHYGLSYDRIIELLKR